MSNNDLKIKCYRLLAKRVIKCWNSNSNPFFSYSNQGISSVHVQCKDTAPFIQTCVCVYIVIYLCAHHCQTLAAWHASDIQRSCGCRARRCLSLPIKEIFTGLRHGERTAEPRGEVPLSNSLRACRPNPGHLGPVNPSSSSDHTHSHMLWDATDVCVSRFIGMWVFVKTILIRLK